MENVDDKKLRHYLQSERKDAPQSQWFTRKVMNRLPEKTNRYGWISKAVSVIALTIVIAVWPYVWGGSFSKIISLTAPTVCNVMTVSAPLITLIVVTTVAIRQTYLSFKE